MTQAAQFNLVRCVADMADEARLAGLRKIANSCAAAIIGAARQQIGIDRANQRDTSRAESIDNRNEVDAHIEAQEFNRQNTENSGGQVEDTPKQHAIKMYWVYRWADEACRALATNQYEEPMTPRSMLSFMKTNNRRMMGAAQLKQFAEYIGCSVDDLKAIKQKQLNDEKDRIINDAPMITAFIADIEADANVLVSEGKDRDGEDAVTDLAPLEQHQLLIKLLDGLFAGYRNALAMALRFENLELAGARPIIRAEILKLVPQIEEFEKLVADDISTAVADGRRVAESRDYRAQLRALQRPAATTEVA